MRNAAFCAASCCAVIVLAAVALGGDGATETRQLLARHQTVAQFTGIAYQTCRGLTALCPNDCGQSGDFASFDVAAYLAYEKPGQYGDEKQKTFTFQVQDNKKNPKIPAELAQQVGKLKAGDWVLLDWRHDYVTRTEAGGGKASFPERPVTKVEPITAEKAAELIAKAGGKPPGTQPASGRASRPASRPATTSAPAPAARIAPAAVAVPF
jgi:hypothetical protein